jgi:hypothetical protein
MAELRCPRWMRPSLDASSAQLRALATLLTVPLDAVVVAALGKGCLVLLHTAPSSRMANDVLGCSSAVGTLRDVAAAM